MLRHRFECLMSMTLLPFTLKVNHAPISGRVFVLNDPPTRVQILLKRMSFLQKALARISCFFLKFLPHWFRLWFFWGPLVRGPFGLVQVKAGETEAVHEQTLAGGSLRTSTRPTLNRRNKSARLYEQSPSR